MNIPKSLEALCFEWRDWLKLIPISIEINDALHVPKAHSIYEMHIVLEYQTEVKHLYYVGRTTSPRARAANHKSALVTCRVTTFTGISVLYTPELLGGVTKIKLVFTVIDGGLTLTRAKNAEKERSAELRLLYGDAVLTTPRGAGDKSEC